MASVEAVQRLLDEGVDKIVQLNGAPSDREAEAFTAFKRGVTQASNGKLGTPSDLLDDLEPKDVVLRFLFDLHERRRLYRKQIAAMMSILMETAWVEILRRDEVLRAAIPAELAELGNLVDEAETPRNEDSKSSESLGYWSTAFANTDKRQEIPVLPVLPPAVVAALEMLQKAKAAIADLSFSAVKRDDAIDAFELLRKAILRVTSLSSSEGRDALNSMDCKGRILEFLIDFHARQSKFRSRVSSVLLKLQGFENWEAAANEDPSVKAAVKELTEDLSQPARKLTVFRAGVAINLAAAAAAVGSRGGLGALYVRVFSAKLPRDSGNADVLGRLPDPYVRVSMDGSTKRTAVQLHTLEPCWDFEPFLFDVPSIGTLVQLDILDTDGSKDHLLGSVTLCASEASREPGFVTHALDGDGKGELQLEMVFAPAKEVPDEVERRKRRTRTSIESQASVIDSLMSAVEQLEAMPGPNEGWLVMQAGKPSCVSFTSAKTNGPLTCPAGHGIEKKKEGLHWYEGWVGYKHGQHCDLCGHTFTTREEARYRCKEHCHYDVCEPCYTGGLFEMSSVNESMIVSSGMVR